MDTVNKNVTALKKETVAAIVVMVVIIIILIIVLGVVVGTRPPQTQLVVNDPSIVVQQREQSAAVAPQTVAPQSAAVMPQTIAPQSAAVTVAPQSAAVPQTIAAVVVAPPPKPNPFIPNPPLLRVDPSNDPNEACINRVFSIAKEETGVKGLVWPRGKPSFNTESGELAKKIIDYLREYPHDPAVAGLTGAQQDPTDARFQYPSYQQFDFADLDLGIMNGAKGQLKRAARTIFYVDASQDQGNCEEQIATIQLQSFVGFTPALQARNYSEYLALVKRFRETEADTQVGVGDEWDDQDPWAFDTAEGRVYEDYIERLAQVGPVLDDDAIIQKPLYPVTTAEILPTCPDTFCNKDGPVFSSVCEQ